MMMQEQIREEAGGAMLFDASLAPAADVRWFDRGYWQQRDALRVQSGGRGGVAVIDTPAGACVLRHYHRGGLVAKFNHDHYLWTGAAHTRSFAEFRLLAHAAGLELPAPQPVAARYRRHGLSYTADLITRRIEDAHTLAQCLAEGRLDADLARETGALVARFHREGIWHADLNAHNVLVTAGALYLIDFDRGALRTPAEAWRLANLARLRRSLVKLGAIERIADFQATIWGPLVYGYERTLGA
ncbi:3-deoxy-D-manno-octulosonic acid kinase [Frateuria sp. STR12]|uniref:3-deoxy-D-manno-octulosonic acid kinase n=1 Tax=Frateuria hangzhouensis TaxID=2995589 RepID=UPI002260C238|nr:3-deoxy-D-manno-octulosonic acid kinase [Frateuria sp. STR12]MCX7512484.1 3-deoxy-D-manno-octulosonic acid kinase [Frateuria sp. STR12]